MWTSKTKPGGGVTTLGGGTATSGGGMPHRLRNAVPARYGINSLCLTESDGGCTQQQWV